MPADMCLAFRLLDDVGDIIEQNVWPNHLFNNIQYAWQGGQR